LLIHNQTSQKGEFYAVSNQTAQTSLEPSGDFLIDATGVFRFSSGSMQVHARTPEEMEQLGRAEAANVRPGSVIALIGALGAGKTLWTKGLVAGLGSSAEVTSPTFGLVHEYPGGSLPIFHLDFYRLESPRDVIALGWDEYLEAGGVIVAEWGDKFPELMPADSRRLVFLLEADGSRTLREETA